MADLVSGMSFLSLVPRARTGFLLNLVRPSGEEGELVAALADSIGRACLTSC